ncbi:9457_t:CDS:2 [Dentiscutata heterogama]|uniref:9457_t:CDS:1 n=1 Tax=Dentiscutata heterogama TaxID=1316150 RepID=A0ACA9KG60_9GLOM|nr:9457_t:CDS:2 [Dentiscutata heterogama]
MFPNRLVLGELEIFHHLFFFCFTIFLNANLKIEFCWAVSKYIEFGGKIQNRVELHNKIFTGFKENKFGTSIQNFSSSYDIKKSTSCLTDYASDSYIIVGGDEEIAPNIDNDKIITVYELLDNKLQAQLLELLEHVVLHSGTNEVEFDNKNIIKSKKLQLDIPENILDNMETNHIYATVYNTKYIHEIFFVHVVYYPNKSSSLILNCVKTKEEKELLSKKDFKHIIKVSWIIVGSRINFKFKSSLTFVLNSYTLKDPLQRFYDNSELNYIKKKIERDLSKEIKHLNFSMCCLGICAFRCQDTDDIESAIIAGLHFCHVDGQKCEPCTYIFDIVKVHLSIINAKQECNEVKWTKCDDHSTYKGEE